MGLTMSRCEHLQNRGLRLWVAGEKLRVAPPEKLTPEVADFIREHREEIITELRSSIYHNPYPLGTPGARQESLMQCMKAIWQPAFTNVKEAYEGEKQQFKATPHIRTLEQRIAALQKAILKGEAKLSEFDVAAHEWERAYDSTSKTYNLVEAL
jgi:carbamoylphosphate synthase large subunit